MHFVPFIFLFLFLDPICHKTVTQDEEKQYPDVILGIDAQAVSNKQTELRSYWAEEPDVLICDNVATFSRVQRALNYWKKNGYSFGEVRKINTTECLESDTKTGAIFIQLPFNNQNMTDKLALTDTTKIISSNQNVRANIYIQSFAVDSRYVLEHEIGHALGWYHSSTRYHIMYPDARMVGSSSRGVRYDNYKIMVSEQFNYFLR